MPGTKTYDDFAGSPGIWHFTFHWVNHESHADIVNFIDSQQQIDLPESLVEGRERIYIKHFYDRLSRNPDAISPADLDHYAMTFAQPGAMRAGFDVYRAFHQDCEDNRALLKRNGPCSVPAQTLNGDGSFLAGIAQDMVSEMYADWTTATVERSGHWCAEENPEDFVAKVHAFVSKH